MVSLQAAAAESGREDTDCRTHWQLRSGAPLLRRGLCSLAQPCLEQSRYMPRFQFHEATVVLIAAGQLDLDDGVNRISVDASSSLLLVEPNTCADVLKTPGGNEQRFRSVVLTVPTALLDTFRRSRPSAPVDEFRPGPFRVIPLDEDLASTLRLVLDSIDVQRVSDERLQYRLMDLLAALAERGHHFFGQTGLHDISVRLRTLIAEAPEQHWTAQKAGPALAMSEATLRRRLANERLRFEDLLIDVRMHHAMMLVQTTSWNMPYIAQACGYKSSARFAERFRARFGYLPSAVR
ncbi:AraC family transcriptional regulator [Trinickia fusca]|uniref:AraC family transcriptional regulator n=1 Tax=Trinickia fusca TaxID=2419777 RepID=A0A494XE09_9BURK|nr:AraC family transcriptional regulator [Trinickia fusca]RKP46389.1 AraC family transcriptional regulator [Trinickia fusca]